MSAPRRRFATSAASSELAQGYLSAAFGSGPRHSWMAAGVFALAVPLLAMSFFADAATAFASGITAADPDATGTYTWGGISRLQSTVTYTFDGGHGTWTGGAFTPLFYVLWIVATILVGLDSGALCRHGEGGARAETV